VIDRILPEPAGGAHRDPAAMAAGVRQAVGEELAALEGTSADQLRERRAARFLQIGDGV
jgi:acetyl-CoA carboxylase carboxyl transferase subunit alpha